MARKLQTFVASFFLAGPGQRARVEHIEALDSDTAWNIARDMAAVMGPSYRVEYVNPYEGRKARNAADPV